MSIKETKIICCYYREKDNIFVDVYTNLLKNVDTFKIVNRIWDNGCGKIRRVRKVQLLYLILKQGHTKTTNGINHYKHNFMPIKDLSKFQLCETPTMNKKQEKKIREILVECQQGSGVCDSDSEVDDCPNTLWDERTETEGEVCESEFTFEKVKPTEMNDNYLDENDFENMIGRIKETTIVEHKDENQNALAKVGDNKSDEFMNIMTDEVIKNIKMLEDICFISSGEYTLYHDRVILDKPCAHAFGDFVKGRDGHYTDILGSFEYRISRISRLNLYFDIR